MSRNRLATIAVTVAASLVAAAPALAHSSGAPEVTQKTLEIEELGPKYLLGAQPAYVTPVQASQIEQSCPKYSFVASHTQSRAQQARDKTELCPSPHSV